MLLYPSAHPSTLPIPGYLPQPVGVVFNLSACLFTLHIPGCLSSTYRRGVLPIRTPVYASHPRIPPRNLLVRCFIHPYACLCSPPVDDFFPNPLYGVLPIHMPVYASHPWISFPQPLGVVFYPFPWPSTLSIPRYFSPTRWCGFHPSKRPSVLPIPGIFPPTSRCGLLSIRTPLISICPNCLSQPH